MYPLPTRMYPWVWVSNEGLWSWVIADGQSCLMLRHIIFNMQPTSHHKKVVWFYKKNVFAIDNSRNQKLNDDLLYSFDKHACYRLIKLDILIGMCVSEITSNISVKFSIFLLTVSLASEIKPFEYWSKCFKDLSDD